MRRSPDFTPVASTFASWSPRLSTVSIMPLHRCRPPERTRPKSGFWNRRTHSRGSCRRDERLFPCAFNAQMSFRARQVIGDCDANVHPGGTYAGRDLPSRRDWPPASDQIAHLRFALGVASPTVNPIGPPSARVPRAWLRQLASLLAYGFAGRLGGLFLSAVLADAAGAGLACGPPREGFDFTAVFLVLRDGFGHAANHRVERKVRAYPL